LNNINFFSTNDDIAKLLSSRIKNERIAQNLKQEDLAKMADIKTHVIRNLEQKSTITLNNLISIIRALKKLDIFEEMFDFDKERIEVDAFKYQEEIGSKKRQRVRSGK